MYAVEITFDDGAKMILNTTNRKVWQAVEMFTLARAVGVKPSVELERFIRRNCSTSPEGVK